MPPLETIHTVIFQQESFMPAPLAPIKGNLTLGRPFGLTMGIEIHAKINAYIGQGSWHAVPPAHPHNGPVKVAIIDVTTLVTIGHLVEVDALEAVPSKTARETACKGCGARGTGVFVRTALVCSECKQLLGGF